MSGIRSATEIAEGGIANSQDLLAFLNALRRDLLTGAISATQAQTHVNIVRVEVKVIEAMFRFGAVGEGVKPPRLALNTPIEMHGQDQAHDDES